MEFNKVRLSFLNLVWFNALFMNYEFPTAYSVFVLHTLYLKHRPARPQAFLEILYDQTIITYSSNKLIIYRDLWPINTENVDDFDMSLIRVTARRKFYKSAIQTLQQISSYFNPVSKLAALADTFTEIGTVSFLLLYRFVVSQ
ncbi:putative integral membrane protein [Brugia pahangi]